jgi:hypothetical protein
VAEWRRPSGTSKRWLVFGFIWLARREPPHLTVAANRDDATVDCPIAARDAGSGIALNDPV